MFLSSRKMEKQAAGNYSFVVSKQRQEFNLGLNYRSQWNKQNSVPFASLLMFCFYFQSHCFRFFLKQIGPVWNLLIFFVYCARQTVSSCHVLNLKGKIVRKTHTKNPRRLTVLEESVGGQAERCTCPDKPTKQHTSTKLIQLLKIHGALLPSSHKSVWLSLNIYSTAQSNWLCNQHTSCTGHFLWLIWCTAQNNNIDWTKGSRIQSSYFFRLLLGMKDLKRQREMQEEWHKEKVRKTTTESNGSQCRKGKKESTRDRFRDRERENA